jgi:hypothetical protein
MDDLAIIDRFTETFSRYIDSGFGLLAGDVAFLTSLLVAIDITLAGLFWALLGEDNLPAQLIRKVLYVGFFALLLNNFKGLADVVFQSFAGLGSKASGASRPAKRRAGCNRCAGTQLGCAGDQRLREPRRRRTCLPGPLLRLRYNGGIVVDTVGINADVALGPAVVARPPPDVAEHLPAHSPCKILGQDPGTPPARTPGPGRPLDNIRLLGFV